MSQSPQFKSKFERDFAAKLKKKGIKAQYEPITVPYILNCIYKPDFVLSNGVVLELKGELDAISRRKMLAVKQQNPNMDIRFVFMRASNKLRKGSKVTYAKWAEDHGFKWCEGEPPKSWFL